MNVQRLKLSSQKWMLAAFTAFAEGPGSHDLAVHHAGIAAEHLLKAYLASLHPALIVEGKDVNSLLHATGHGAYASAPETHVKTIGLAEAHARVQKILRKRMPVDQRDLVPLATARNGVAHSGLYDRSQVHVVFTTCLRLVDPLLTELGIDSSYWGAYESLRDRLLEERVQVARVRLEGKFTRARGVFSERYGFLGAEQRDLVLSTITRVTEPDWLDHNEQVICPACESPGWLSGETVIDEKEETVIATPVVFLCPACDLRLESDELGEVGDLADEIDLNISPMGFYGPWTALDDQLYREMEDVPDMKTPGWPQQG